MTFNAFGQEIELPNPSFPYSRPRLPAQNTQTTSGQAIYTTSRADIDPREINLNIEDITPEEHTALSDFIVHVIEFSSHPCRIETDIDTFDDMHLIGGWEQVTSQKGDISTARLRFRQGIRALAIGKNQLPTPRLYSGDMIASDWASVPNGGTVIDVQLAASVSPFSYQHYVWRTRMTAAGIPAGSPPSLALEEASALALAGTDLRITCTYRRTTGNNPLRIAAQFSEGPGNAWSLISELQAYVQPENTGTGWQVASGVVSESDFPNNANWVVPVVYAGKAPGDMLANPQTTVHQVAEITFEYAI